VTALCLLLCGCATSVAQSSRTSAQAQGVRVTAGAGVSEALAATVAQWIAAVRTPIERDLGMRRGVLSVHIYATHAAFNRAVHRVQGGVTQGTDDNTSAVVHGTLLLGPEMRAYLRHNLAHVYTEWLLDKALSNRSDRLPRGTWLYDGLAEDEALRYAPAGLHCSSAGSAPLQIMTVDTPRAWMALRAGPLGASEYCLAAVAARRVVRQAGWPCLMSALRHDGMEIVARSIARRGAGALACTTHTPR
jgi:hypothetical protein